MTRLLRSITTLVVVAAAIFLLGCGGSSGKTTTTAAPGGGAGSDTSGGSSRTTATTAAKARLPEGWVEHSTAPLTMALPKEWEAKDFSSGDLQAMYDSLKESSPKLAEYIGSAEALAGTTLWAFAPAVADRNFVDNVNIRQTPLNDEKVDDMQEQLITPLEDEYKGLGYTVTASEANQKVDGFPAAHIAYSSSTPGPDGTPVNVFGHQYVIATDTDIWAVTYSFGADTSAEADLANTSAQSIKFK